jgi:hypothetical protein
LIIGNLAVLTLQIKRLQARLFLSGEVPASPWSMTCLASCSCVADVVAEKFNFGFDRYRASRGSLSVMQGRELALRLRRYAGD